MASENLVLSEVEFIEFQRFCRSKGFDLCYFGSEISGSRANIESHRFGGPRVVKLKNLRFTSEGTPYDVAEWQQKEWSAALPRLRDEFFETGRGAKMANLTEPKTSGLGDARGQLADQLKTVFVAALLTLWTATLAPGANAPVSRGAWWPWAIASAFVFLWMVWRREKTRWPKFKWVFPFMAVDLLWAMYFIGGLSFPAGAFKGVAASLFAWAVLLLVALLIVMTWRLKEGKVDGVIGWIVKWGGAASFPLSLLVLMAGIVMGWARLENAGMRGCWITSILILGMIIFIVIAFAPLRQDKDS